MMVLPASALAQADDPVLVPRATDSAVAAVTSEINAGDDASVAQAEKQIRFWFVKETVPMPFWRTWLPALMNYRRYQEAADLSIGAVMQRPGIEAIAPLLEFRAKALMALYKPREALAAAKSYYNVCALKDTGNALDLIEQCLKPDNNDAVIRFRAEQEAAASAAASGGRLPQSSFLKSVHIDPAPYDQAIKDWSQMPDRPAYANLLLAADRAMEAEAVFRELYKSATDQQTLTVAIDGITRSLRAEDGNVARADVWLMALQRGTASSAAP